MKDHERLELLKEIGGTKVYEERRKDSLKIMTESESRRAQIEEVVSARRQKFRVQQNRHILLSLLTNLLIPEQKIELSNDTFLCNK